MDSESALNFINKLVLARRQTRLNNKQEYLFRGIWSDLTYKQIHKAYPFNCELTTLIKDIAWKFLKLMTDVLSEKVKKNTVKVAIEAAGLRERQGGALHQPEQEERDMSLSNPPDSHPPSDQSDKTGWQGGASSENSSPIEYMQNKIVLIVGNVNRNMRIIDLRRQTRVRSLNPGSIRRVFNLFETPVEESESWSLENILQRLSQEKDQRWVDEFQKSVYLAAKQGSPPQEVISTLQSFDGKLFTTIFDSKKTSPNDRSVEFIIIFHEKISLGYVENAPNQVLATLETAKQLGPRLNWGVCDKYLPKVENCQREDLQTINIILREIKNSFNYIEQDAEIRRQGEASNTSNKDRLRNCFESEDERRIIEDNLSQQQKYKDILTTLDNYHNLDEAKDALNQVRTALIELKPLNKIVMRMVEKLSFQLNYGDSP
ncbi:hypothetical protein NIES4075_63010 [Tolypothrix sp. NIES-4075]|uniref:hypothetical protein n=1 Tax=Tolypothrix sp. NIES-4075 TaxID=2005459 RepID=UPI000B5CFC6D|nr:hypothetical protein [Tolypothrix sp. NIES-4075]GAX45280.1 hypothetical protein NIES4075_63010 [Tolypothrix sp. NIES-4075]